MADSGEVEDTLLATAATTGPDDPIERRSSRASIPLIPTQRYRSGSEIGRGGMGRVVEAVDTQLGRTVALKEVLPGASANLARRFVREIEITARLEHPSIVPIYDSGVTPDGRPFYVMRRLTGRPLDELITKTRGMADRLTLLPAVLAAIDAMAHAHRKGVIHRDLKPSNILVGDLGESVVIDWGLAKVIGEDEISLDPAAAPLASDSLQTQVGSVFGTPGFMAPEQARGDELGPRSDVYALGATLYHLLVGAPPHAGGSATDILGRTLVREVPSLADAAPGAPPELAAIVDKALAFDADRRYADAAALGEDVRRFLSGQLVAAHRYTSRERLQRFTRRHRTAISVAALACIALAGVGVFSVRRILVERDAATEARKEAIEEQRAAEIARDRLAERNDALLITQARALLDTNPTQAIAVLKQLPVSSPRLPDARAVSHAAVTRGVWWAIQTVDTPTLRAELSHDGRQLVQITDDGMVRVWDLDRRQIVLVRSYTRATFATWMANGELLVFSHRMVPERLVPSANESHPLPLPAGVTIKASEDGAYAVATSKDGTWLFENATRTVRSLWEGHVVSSVGLAHDGAWVVLADKHEMVVFARDGRELFRRPGQVILIETSASGSFAVSGITSLTACRLDPQPACTDVPIDGALVVEIKYVGEMLHAFIKARELVSWNGKFLWRRGEVNDRLTPLSPAADSYAVVAGRGELQVFGTYGSTTVKLPVHANPIRIASRRNGSRVVAVTQGAILGLDLANCVPRLLETSSIMNARLIDDDVAIGWKSQHEWAWLDLERGTRDAFNVEMRGMLLGFGADAASRRYLVIEGFPADQRLWLFRQGAPPRLLLTGSSLIATLVAGDAIVVAGAEDSSRSRVFGAVGDADPVELARLDSPVFVVAGTGPHQFAALSENGELVRGDVRTGVLERTREAKPRQARMDGDGAGGVLVALDHRLVWWTNGKLVEIARFGQDIGYLRGIDGQYAIVSLADRDTLVVKLEPNATPKRLFMPSAVYPVISADGRTAVTLGAREELVIGELPSLARWTVPPFVLPLQGSEVSISPSSRQVLIPSRSGLSVWTLPSSRPDFGAWLDEQTNAVIVDDVLVWPWLARSAGGNPPAP